MARARISGSTEASPELVEIGRGLIAEIDRLVERIARMIREMPEYRSVKSDTLWNDVRQISAVHVKVFIDAVVRGRIPSDKDIRAAGYFARRRVHQGVPLRGPLNAYRNGIWLLWEELVTAVRGRPQLQDELLMRAVWAFRYLDVVTSAVTEAYYSEEHGRTQNRDRVLRDLFDEMVGGGTSSPAELEARAADVGFDLDSSFHVLVLTTGKDPKPVGLPSAAVVSAVAEAAAVALDRIISVERNREFLLVTPGGVTMPLALLRSNLAGALESTEPNVLTPRVGISGRVSGIEGVRLGYAEGKRAIEFGQALHGSELVHFYEDYVLHDALDGCAKKVGTRLIVGSLGPLLDLGETGQRLLETLDAYVKANGNFKAAAGMLDVHPNTLTYRMRQILQYTGLDVNQPDHRLQAELALRVHLMQPKGEGRPSGRGATGKKTPRSARPAAGAGD
jgi:sugar diacid utilization regulator